MISAVGYIRMSSDKQEASPDQQRQEITALAEREGYRVIRWYIDEGISGDATEKRLDFQRMIRDSERGDFQAVLCWDQDRFGRFDSIEAGHWIHPLRENGVHLVTVAQGKIDWSDFAGRMLYGIQQEGKHAYLWDLSRNICRGLREKAKQGKWPSGAPPFGYVIGSDGKLTLGNPKHVRAVQRVFREYLSGNSMRAIAERMRAAGQPAPGRDWTRDAVRTVLENKIYTGDFSWGKRRYGKYHHATEQPIVITGNHGVIIDRRTFEAVQGRRVEQRGGKTPKPNGGTFVLTGLVRCHQCGKRMHGHTTRENRYLICGGHSRRGNAFCDRNSVREDVVLDQIIEAIERVYLNPELIRRIREELHRQVQDGSAPADVGPLTKQLAQVEKDLQTARRNMALADPGLIPEYEQVFRELRSRKASLKAEIKTGSGPTSEQSADETVDRAIALLSQLRPTCRRANPAQLREFLRQAVEKVVIRVDKRRMGRQNRYKLRGGEIHMRVNNLGVTVRRCRSHSERTEFSKAL